MKRVFLGFLLIFLCGVTRGQKVDTFEVLFPINDSNITTDAQANIDQLVSQNKLTPGQSLIILGYTDYLGDNNYNFRLSELRAKHVQDQLVSKGFNRNDIKICIGKGEIERNLKNAEGNPADRKVQIIVEKIEAADNIASEPLFNISKLNENDVVPLDNVLFELGSTFFIYSSYVELEKIADFLKQNPSVKIQIEGHLCCPVHGSDHATEAMMSLKRAKAVYNYLMTQDIAKDRLKCIGLGTKHPFVEPEKTPEDEALNRRVAIRILSK